MCMVVVSCIRPCVWNTITISDMTTNVFVKLMPLVEQASKDIRYYPYIALKEIAQHRHLTRAIDDLVGKYKEELDDRDGELER